MDEPLNGLDQKSIKVFKVICEKHTKAGGAILFSSHIDPKLKITKKVIFTRKILKKLIMNFSINGENYE